jgi:transcriptional regulator with XRE-family HTH domain
MLLPMDDDEMLRSIDDDFTVLDIPEETSPLDLLAQVVRVRRRYLGLDQAELADYGGPGVSTVWKIENAAQGSYAARTKHQLENALGIPRGSVDRLLKGPLDAEVWSDPAERGDLVSRAIHAPIPDLSTPALKPGPAPRRATELTDDELLAELTYRMKKYAQEQEVTGNAEHPAPMNGVNVHALRRPDETPAVPDATVLSPDDLRGLGVADAADDADVDHEDEDRGREEDA